MNYLKQLMKKMNHNGEACLLLVITVMLAPPTSLAPYLSTPPINRLETSMLPNTSLQLYPQVNQLQVSTLIKPSHSVGYLTSIGMDEVKPDIFSTDDAFDGFNLFELITEGELSESSLLVTNMKGEIIRKNEYISFPQGVSVWAGAKFINSTTLLLPTKNAALWNIYDNTKVDLGFWGHHELEYNSLNNTFFTFNQYIVEIDGVKYLFDIIEEYNTTGQLVWSLDTHSFISHTQWCPYRDMWREYADITHANSIFFDTEEDVIYVNVRNVNTFYKINHKTKQVLWGLGEYGNFTLFDRHGNRRKNLFHHAHTVEKVDEDTFILFDNDLHNQTNIKSKQSRILEIRINETTMTANESWVWTAPPDYYSLVYGDADRLPNGNRLGTFGAPWKRPFNPDAFIGARLVEVNDAGEIVWEMFFHNTEKIMYAVYRLERFRLSPILSSPPDIRTLSSENVTVTWQTWYNFRTNRRMKGAYTLYLDGEPIENNSHVFNKFWQPTNLTFNLGKLDASKYNLTLSVADEAGHITTDSLNISIITFYVERKGPLITELGQENALLQWNGYTSRPLLANLTLNNTQIAAFVWNGSIITLDLNSFDPDTYFVTLYLFDTDILVYKDEFLVIIYPVSTPSILSFPEDQSITWNTPLMLSWEISNPFPASWSIFVNDTLIVWSPWDIPSFLLTWNVPVLDEGSYNITFVAYNRVGRSNSKMTWLTVIPPNPPVIANVPHQTELQWGDKNASLSWEVHGGTYWTLWKNGKAAYNGEITNDRIEVQIKNWQQEGWRPGTYNLTLQVLNEGGAAATRTSWIQVWVNLGDPYADSVITEASLWYYVGEYALGPPDGKFARLYADYGNGHVTLDMGLDEEILDGNGVDLIVYARGSEYVVFVGDNLSASIPVEKQVSAPLTLLGIGVGNSSFDLANAGVDQARYIQIVYLADEDVELDAVVAVHFNRPPKPTLISARWMVILSGGSLSLLVLLVLWVRRRKR